MQLNEIHKHTIWQAPDGRCWKVLDKGHDYQKQKNPFGTPTGPTGEWVEIQHQVWKPAEDGGWTPGPEATKIVSPNWFGDRISIVESPED